MIKLENACKIYRIRNEKVKALDNINLHITEGEFIVVRGPSGSGKSTLLFAIGGMLKVTSGLVNVNGMDIYKLDEKNRANFRAENIGFVFQMFHLVPYLNVIENVLLPAGSVKNESLSKSAAKDLLKKLHLEKRMNHKPSEMSAGENQRVAIARSLIIKPKIILADEPTGNLDPENANEVIGHLREFHKIGGTVLAVTHGTDADQFADRIVHLRKGRVLEE
jgi:ABC-type lipoprotein export system ATPase subunit